MADKKYIVDDKEFSHLRTLLLTCENLDDQIAGLLRIKSNLLGKVSLILTRIQDEQDSSK